MTHLLDNYDDDEDDVDDDDDDGDDDEDEDGDDDDDVDDDDPQLLIKFLAGAKWRLVSQSGSQLTSSDVSHILLSGE